MMPYKSNHLIIKTMILFLLIRLPLLSLSTEENHSIPYIPPVNHMQIFNQVNEIRAQWELQALEKDNQLFLMAQGLADQIAVHGKQAESHLDCIAQYYSYAQKDSLLPYIGYGSNLDSILYEYSQNNSYLYQSLNRGGIGISRLNDDSQTQILVILGATVFIEIEPFPLVLHPGEYTLRWRVESNTADRLQPSPQSQESPQRRMPGISVPLDIMPRANFSRPRVVMIDPNRNIHRLETEFEQGLLQTSVSLNQVGEYEIEWMVENPGNRNEVLTLHRMLLQVISQDDTIENNPCGYEPIMHKTDSLLSLVIQHLNQVRNDDLWLESLDYKLTALCQRIIDNQGVIQEDFTALEMDIQLYNTIIYQWYYEMENQPLEDFALPEEDFPQWMLSGEINRCGAAVNEISENALGLALCGTYEYLSNIIVEKNPLAFTLKATSLEDITLYFFIDNQQVGDYSVAENQTFQLRFDGAFTDNTSISIRIQKNGQWQEIYRF